MSGTVWVDGSGLRREASEVDIQALRTAEAAEAVGVLGALRATASSPGEGWVSVDEAAAVGAVARERLDRLAEQARQLSAGLRRSADEYGKADARAEERLRNGPSGGGTSW